MTPVQSPTVVVPDVLGHDGPQVSFAEDHNHSRIVKPHRTVGGVAEHTEHDPGFAVAAGRHGRASAGARGCRAGDPGGLRRPRLRTGGNPRLGLRPARHAGSRGGADQSPPVVECAGGGRRHRLTRRAGRGHPPESRASDPESTVDERIASAGCGHLVTLTVASAWVTPR